MEEVFTHCFFDCLVFVLSLSFGMSGHQTDQMSQRSKSDPSNHLEEIIALTISSFFIPHEATIITTVTIVAIKINVICCSCFPNGSFGMEVVKGTLILTLLVSVPLTDAVKDTDTD